jgi:2-amino-4-hydroxy-6-hydroxymethyldihydropteridine diphosphokinase
VRVFVGLGSNLGDRAAFLEGAVEGLRRVDPDLECSPIYETAPVGGPAGQGPYLNCVVSLDTDLEPHALLAVTRALEAEADRARVERWGARTLDIDILLVGDVSVDDEELVVPHPRMGERAFVLAPLEDLDPTRVPANWRDALGGDAAVEQAVWRVEARRRS